MANEEKLVITGKIINGPSKWDLIIKSFAGYKAVSFSLKCLIDNEVVEMEINLVILGIISGYPSEDCDNWIICGKESNLIGIHPKILHALEPGRDEAIYFSATYSTQRRQGDIRFKACETNPFCIAKPTFF